MTESPVIASLRRALVAVPDDVSLRLHLAELLLVEGRGDEAVAECATALQHDPTSAHARGLMGRALGLPGATPAAGPTPRQATEEPFPAYDPHAASPVADEGPAGPAQEPTDAAGEEASGFDWEAAETEVKGIAEPMFVEGEESVPAEEAFDVEKPRLTLADVAGMSAVKDRINAAFLAPLRNPELRRLYGKSLRGGMLMYGPPGCGKTYIARATAGELGVRFINVGISDILDQFIGNSEQNIHEIFQLARREAPAVLFLDELDTLGGRRSQQRNSGLRGAINQLLVELDGVDAANEGVFVLGATNQPWDIDPALRRPGRLDRTVLVLPPDGPAREGIFRMHLKERPVEGIDLVRLAKASDGMSSADIAYVCDLAAENALMESVRTGRARLMSMTDLMHGLSQAQPSMNAWFNSARNLVEFAEDDGTHAELRAYLKKRRLI